MRLGQIRFQNKLTAAVFEDGGARPIPGYSTVELIRKAATESAGLAELADELATRHAEACPPVIPIHPVEVWACGCTFEKSATSPCGKHGGAGDNIYGKAYGHERPEIFFKGTAGSASVQGRISASALIRNLQRPSRNWR